MVLFSEAHPAIYWTSRQGVNVDELRLSFRPGYVGSASTTIRAFKIHLGLPSLRVVEIPCRHVLFDRALSLVK